MVIFSWLSDASDTLQQLNISTARLDALVLLADELSKDKAWVLAHPEFELTQTQVDSLDEKIQRRAKHEPLAYIRGKSEFFGREFIVNSHTLEPRPETETMIELLKKHVGGPESPFTRDLQLQGLDGVQGNNEKQANCTNSTESESRKQLTQQSAKRNVRVAGFASNHKVSPLTIVDVGTGSGCLAITAKLECSNAQVYATDIDSDCITIGQKNAELLKANVQFLQGNLLDPLTEHNIKPDILLCNLPYVPDEHTINKAATFEPRHAIFGGPDGLDLYRRLFEQFGSLKRLPKYVLTESLPFQHKELAAIAASSGFTLIESRDFIQVFTSR